MRLNAYVAAAGVCSRRKAVELVKGGLITVNGNIHNDPSYVVQSHDDIRLQGRRLKLQNAYVYIMLNKPKGYVTTTADERGRRTVLDLLGKKQTERIYPIGRLDRDTTGLLLLTNDGPLAHALMHPRRCIHKEYRVYLDKNLEDVHLAAIKKGVYLFDGRITVDEIKLPKQQDRRTVLLTIHSGKKRIIRRLFYSLGYEVKQLERVAYAGLTLRGLESGAWRYLTATEITSLQANMKCE